jgi:hypothetical protein
MTRKEFLQYAAGAIVVLFGFSNLVSLFTSFTTTTVSPSKDLSKESKHGFGSRKFGV